MLSTVLINGSTNSQKFRNCRWPNRNFCILQMIKEATCFTKAKTLLQFLSLKSWLYLQLPLDLWETHDEIYLLWPEETGHWIYDKYWNSHKFYTQTQTHTRSKFTPDQVIFLHFCIYLAPVHLTPGILIHVSVCTEQRKLPYLKKNLPSFLYLEFLQPDSESWATGSQIDGKDRVTLLRPRSMVYRRVYKPQELQDTTLPLDPEMLIDPPSCEPEK